MQIKKYKLRGFSGVSFKDYYGSVCSLQESSLATEIAVWFGVDKDFEGKKSSRMHLTQKQVKKLLPYLIKFSQQS